MFTKRLYLAVALIAAAILAGLALHAYVVSRVRVAEALQSRQDLQNEVEGLRHSLAGSLAQIETDKRQLRTPQQIVARLPEYLPGLPVAPTLMDTRRPPTKSSDDGRLPAAAVEAGESVIAADAGSGSGEGLESNEAAPLQPGPKPSLPPGVSPGEQALIFPTPDIKPLFDYLADCKGCSAQVTELRAENVLLQKRARAAERAMKGGSFWGRLKTDVKIVVITGLVAGAAGYAAHR